MARTKREKRLVIRLAAPLEHRHWGGLDKGPAACLSRLLSAPARSPTTGHRIDTMPTEKDGAGSCAKRAFTRKN